MNIPSMYQKFKDQFQSLRDFIMVFQQDLTDEELEFLVIDSIDAILDNAAPRGSDETWWKIIYRLRHFADGLEESIINREKI